MRLIIAGCRDVFDLTLVTQGYNACGWDKEVTMVVSGGQRGIDRAGEYFAKAVLRVPVAIYPVTDEEWKRYGLKAGPLRNEKMAQNADRLLAIWDGKSRGTKSMIDIAKRYGLPTYIHLFKR